MVVWDRIELYEKEMPSAVRNTLDVRGSKKIIIIVEYEFDDDG